MVTRHGTDETLGLAPYEPPSSSHLAGVAMAPRERQYGEETAREIDCAVRDILRRAFDPARVILTENREALDRGARDFRE